MKLSVVWHKPVDLRDGDAEENLEYACDDLERVPSEPGIYVFARQFGDLVIPLYIGQALKIRSRVRGQLNNLKLMKGIRRAGNGKRIVLIGTLSVGKGQKAEKALDVLERAYIENALTAGFELLNIKGTKTPVDTIASGGKKGYHKPFPRRMNL